MRYSGKAFCVLFVGMGIMLSSCYKAPFYKCEVTVVDAVNIPVSGAHVDLLVNVNPPSSVGANGTTDGSGQIEFEFDQELVLEVHVVKDSLSGTGLIKLENRETVSTTIVIE